MGGCKGGADGNIAFVVRGGQECYPLFVPPNEGSYVVGHGLGRTRYSIIELAEACKEQMV